MIIMSFIFADKHYRIRYDFYKLIPYFVLAIFMVAFGQIFNYPDLFTELLVNTLFIVVFILYAQYKDKLPTVFFRR
jgi:hypothetical protein